MYILLQHYFSVITSDRGEPCPYIILPILLFGVGVNPTLRIFLILLKTILTNLLHILNNCVSLQCEWYADDTDNYDEPGFQNHFLS